MEVVPNLTSPTQLIFYLKLVIFVIQMVIKNIIFKVYQNKKAEFKNILNIIHKDKSYAPDAPLMRKINSNF